MYLFKEKEIFIHMTDDVEMQLYDEEEEEDETPQYLKDRIAKMQKDELTKNANHGNNVALSVSTAASNVTGTPLVDPTDARNLFAQRTLTDRLKVHTGHPSRTDQHTSREVEQPFTRKVFLASASITSGFLHKLRSAEAEAAVNDYVLKEETVQKVALKEETERSLLSSKANKEPIDAGSKRKSKTQSQEQNKTATITPLFASKLADLPGFKGEPTQNTKTEKSNRKKKSGDKEMLLPKEETHVKTNGVRVPAFLVNKRSMSFQDAPVEESKNHLKTRAKKRERELAPSVNHPPQSKHLSREESAIMDDQF